MANQYYWSVSWVSTDGFDMAPGECRVLAVENVQMDGVPDGGRALLFVVKNTGNTYIPGYIVGSSVVNQ